MTDHDEYFRYLTQRSRLGHFYRNQVLYPRLSRRLVGRTLDIGCGIGDMLLYRPDTVGVDVNPRTVEFCRSRGAQAHLVGVDALPFADESFDSALMDNVLEHIEAPDRLLQEVRRVLKRQGRLLVGVPGVKGWDSDPDHKVRYDERSLADTGEKAGFALRELFHTPLWRSAWLSSRMRQYCIYALFERQDAGTTPL